MKIVYTLLITITLVACGNADKQSLETVIASNDLTQIRAKKDALFEQKKQLTDQLKTLEAKIQELDPLKKIPLITTFITKPIEFKHFVELQGSVDTKKNILITAEYAGLLEQVLVKEGQQVRQGQTLARIEDGGLQQQLAQLTIQATLAKTTFERQQRLWQQKIGSEIQYLQAKTNYEAQQQAINQLKKQIAKTIIRAPFSGVIDEIITEQGTVVAPGQSAIFRIVNLGDMYIETEVPETFITAIKPGKLVEVNFPVLGTNMQSKVRQVSTFINPANRTFKIQIPISNTNKLIKPNLTAKLKINDYTNPQAILIPQSVISENAKGQRYVYTVTDKKGTYAKAVRSIITTGKTQGDVIEVLSGLSPNGELILEGARSVKDGQAVEILNAQ